MSGTISNSKEGHDGMPLPELSLNLHNFDTPEAQSCPYVLTSPRSLEACSRLGIKPVDLLHKTLAEFQDDLPPGKPLEDIFKLYDEYERNRTALLAKCQSEREYIIWRSSVNQRSQSLSPGRREKISIDRSLTSTDDQPFNALRPRNAPLEYERNVNTTDDIHCQQTLVRRRGRPLTRNFSLRSLQPTSWSTPASPFYRGSQTLFLPITSPLLRSKLQSFPGAKMRLPPKDVKILELILQKYEHYEEEEDRRAAARRQWEKERKYREKQKEMIELERWRTLAAKSQMNALDEKSKPKESTSLPANHHLQDMSSKNEIFDSEIEPHDETMELYEKQKNSKEQAETEPFSHYDLAQKLHSLQLKEERFEQRHRKLLQKRDESLKRSAEELNEKLKQARLNQQELDKALEKWREQVTSYQEAANRRAVQRAAETLELRRQKIRQERLTKEADHKKKMQQIEAEKEVRLHEMIAKLKDKDEKSRAFIQEKITAIEQSRSSAQAASDLRELLRQKLDRNSFVKRCQQAMLESRLEKLPYIRHQDNPNE